MRWIIVGPYSSYSWSVIHMDWNVERLPSIDPPSHENHSRSARSSIPALLNVGLKRGGRWKRQLTISIMLILQAAAAGEKQQTILLLTQSKPTLFEADSQTHASWCCLQNAQCTTWVRRACVAHLQQKRRLRPRRPPCQYVLGSKVGKVALVFGI